MAKTNTLMDATKRMQKIAGKKGTAEPQTNDTKMLNTRIPKDLIKRMKFYCADKELTIQDFITEAVREKLEASDF